MVVDISGNAIEVGEVGNCPSLAITVTVGVIDNCLDGISIVVVHIGGWSDTGGGVGGSDSELVMGILSPVLAVTQMITQSRMMW